MKTFIYKSIAAFFLVGMFLCTSCSKQDTSDHGLITVTAAIGTNLKTQLWGQTTYWVYGDKIGIFSEQARLTNIGLPPVLNDPFTAQDDGIASRFTGTMFWGTGTHIFYAYYPYTLLGTNQSAIPIKLPNSQTQINPTGAFAGDMDYTWATPLSKVEGQKIQFSFNHAFAMLQMQFSSTTLNTANLGGHTDLFGIKIKGNNRILAFTDGTMDIANGNLSITGGTSNEITVTYSNGGRSLYIDGATPGAMYMLVAPGGSGSSDKISFAFQFSAGGAYSDWVQKSTNIIFEAGTLYHITGFN